MTAGNIILIAGFLANLGGGFVLMQGEIAIGAAIVVAGWVAIITGIRTLSRKKEGSSDAG